MSISFHWRLPIGVLTAMSLLGLATGLSGRGTGVTPGYFQVPTNLTRAFPGCGSGTCHSIFPNTYGVAIMELLPATTSVDAGATIDVTIHAKGGRTTPPNLGGFCVETPAGTWTAQGNTDVGRDENFVPVPNIITHTNNTTRSWTVKFTAANTPGALDWFAACNTVNGDGRSDFDSWNWWQANPLFGQPGTPFRMFVNAVGVSAFGSGCKGKDGLAPVTGAAVSPAVGAGNFAIAVRNIPFLSAVLSVLGTSNQSYGGIPLPFDLGVVGAPGCQLWTNLVAMQVAVATTGAATPGGGSASTPWPIPNDPTLRGGSLYFTNIVLDAAANAGGMTTSAGLKVTIQ
jgi:hypothetical protein